MPDLIDRQAAIDALAEPCEVSDTWTDEYAVGERMQWEKDVKVLNNLPSAQPEYTEQDMRDEFSAGYDCGMEAAQHKIVRCKDCKHRDPEDHKCDCGHDIMWQLPRQDDWYCADAERRTDE